MFTPVCKPWPVDQTGNGLGWKASCHVLIHLKMKLIAVAIFFWHTLLPGSKGYQPTGWGNCTADIWKRLWRSFQRMLSIQADGWPKKNPQDWDSGTLLQRNWGESEVKRSFKSWMMCKLLALRSEEFYLKHMVYLQGNITNQLLGKVWG